MLWKGIFFSLVLGLLKTTPVLSQKFACDGRLFISLTNPIDSYTEVVTTSSEAGEVSFTPVTNAKDIIVNGLGFNAVDNFIYAIHRQTHDIIRLSADNSYQIVGSENSTMKWHFSAADCSPNGHFVVNNRQTSELLYLNVLQVPDQQELSLHASVVLHWAPSSGNSGKVVLELDDFVFDPKDPYTIYTFQRNRLSYPYAQEPENTRGTLLKIDGDPDSPAFGTVSAVGDGIDESLARTVGALFFDAFGNLYGYASEVMDPLRLDRLIAINKETGTARLVGEGPVAIGTDGCSCPYTLMLSMQASAQEVVCQEVIDYEITLTNSFSQPISGLEYHHSLPEGMTIQSLSAIAPGTVKDGTGEGFNTLILENVSLPDDAEITFTVQVQVGSQVGSFYHQAELRSVPPELGGTLRSDDVATDIPGDASLIVVQAPDWTASEVSVLNADPCAENTFTLRIANEQFERDVPYYVSYQQDGVAAEPQELYAETAGELLMSGLEAGTYSDLILSPSPEGGCASGLEGSWTIDPVPSPQAIALSSNSPVCESENLQLAASTESAAFYWTGPQDFYSEQIDPVIEEVNPEQSGYYYFHRSVEACTLVDSVEIVIHALPELNLGPDTTMRRGEEIQLQPTYAFPEDIVYQWFPEQDISCTDCASPWVNPSESTVYELQIIGPGGCVQIDRIAVEVLDAAVLSVPNAFTPNNDGLNDVFYPTGDEETMNIVCMDVYNRWGELIFRQQNFPANTEARGWNGTYRGKKVAIGAYHYRIEAELPAGEQRTYQGQVQLLP